MEPPGPSRSRTADAARVAIPLLIAFAAPSSLVVERDRPSQFPILGNGPPGTFVLFPGRLRVSLRRCCAVRKLTRNAPYPQTR